jgi:hypothetical protein
MTLDRSSKLTKSTTTNNNNNNNNNIVMTWRTESVVQYSREKKN